MMFNQEAFVWRAACRILQSSFENMTADRPSLRPNSDEILLIQSSLKRLGFHLSVWTHASTHMCTHIRKQNTFFTMGVSYLEIKKK